MSSAFAKHLESYLLAASLLLDSPEDLIASKILQESKRELEENVYHDNWDGGIDYHTLKLCVSLTLFKEVKDRLNEIEGKICQTIQQLSRDLAHEGLSSVTILPEMPNIQEKSLINEQIPNTAEKNVAMEEDKNKKTIAVFISHLAKYKNEATALKQMLGCFGISAFVAHEDITPTAEWQVEIEKALRECRCLVALLKDGFHESPWTDQEIGFAYARNIKIIPVIQGVNPYGFIGKIQGLKCDERYLWWEIYKRLPLFKGEHDAFFYAVSKTKSYIDARELAKIFHLLIPFTQNEIEILFNLSVQNENIHNSHTFWQATTHSKGMLAYIKSWVGIEYEQVYSSGQFECFRQVKH